MRCRFGRFGETNAVFINSTAIKCTSPPGDDPPDAIYRETVILSVAMNGQDFTGSIDFEFSPNLQLYRILPQSGPFDKAIATSVRLYGTGFDA